MECSKADVMGLMRAVKYSSAQDVVLVKDAVVELCTDFDPASRNQIDANLIILSVYLVVLLQTGFAMLTGGTVSQNKAPTTLLSQNLLLACTTLLGFFSLGYGFAFGTFKCGLHSPYIGAGIFSSNDTDSQPNWVKFLFQWAFACTAATVSTGSIGERATLASRFGQVFYIAAFIYPVVAHWVWDVNGWLYVFGKDALFGIGMIDFTGAGAVHVLGGFVGLIGSIVLGYPHREHSLQMKPQMPLMIVGSLLVWFAWYSLVPGTAIVLGNNHAVDNGRVAIVITLSSASSGIASFMLHYGRTREWEHKMCLGILGGLVATSAGSIAMAPWAGVATGVMSAIILCSGQMLRKWFKVFDPLEAITLHGAVGAWGILSVGLFAQPEYVAHVFSRNNTDISTIDPANYTGIFYGGNGLLLAVQSIGLLAIAAWTTLQILPFFLVLDLSHTLKATEDEHECKDSVVEEKCWLLTESEQCPEV